MTQLAEISWGVSDEERKKKKSPKKNEYAKWSSSGLSSEGGGGGWGGGGGGGGVGGFGVVGVGSNKTLILQKVPRGEGTGALIRGDRLSNKRLGVLRPRSATARVNSGEKGIIPEAHMTHLWSELLL